MFRRQLSTRFDVLHSNVQEKVLKKQDKQKKYFDRSAKEQKFSRGDDVYIRNFSQDSKVKMDTWNHSEPDWLSCCWSSIAKFNHDR